MRIHGAYIAHIESIHSAHSTNALRVGSARDEWPAHEQRVEHTASERQRSRGGAYTRSAGSSSSPMTIGGEVMRRWWRDPFIYPMIYDRDTLGTRYEHARNTLEERWAR